MICIWIKRLFRGSQVDQKDTTPDYVTDMEKDVKDIEDEAEKVFDEADSVFKEYDDIDKILDEANRSE